MIGIVLIGHSRIASEMLVSLQYVVGEQPLMDALDVTNDSSPELIADMLITKIRTCDVGQGVLLLADMFGGTPCNVAMGCLRAGHVEVVSGFNLPLLIKAATLRHHVNSLSELAQQVVRAGRQYIQVAPNITTTDHISSNGDSVKHADA
ncbi:MAG: PTS system fructose subfamily IIA component [Mariprofundus sp.]|nr:PTS system fructose subfamily IIA component [Mariprofundus sp.]